MTNSLFNQILRVKFYLLLFLIACSLSISAQEKYSITGKVKIENGSIDNTILTVYKNAEKLESNIIDNSGKFNYDLEFGNDYIFEFSKENFVTKKVSISTFVPEEVLNRDSQFPPFKFMVSLFPAYHGLDLSIFNQPMGIIMYDKELDDFDYDRDYDAQIRDAIKKAEEEARRKAEELEAERLAKENAYKGAIQKGDLNFNGKKYDEAKMAYNEALSIKPEEKYPKDQITKIDNLLTEQQRKADEAAKLAAEKKALDEKYAAIINLADSQFNSGDYSAAKNSYSDAFGLKANEQYPKDQITKIDNLLAEQQRKADEAAKLAAEKKALDEKYAAIINLADSQFNVGDYSVAKNSYSDALGLKANEQYPKDQITKIDNLLAEQQRKADEAAKLAAEKKALDEKYAAIINLADSQFKSGDYSAAKNSYSDALGLKANEQYPKDQIIKIDNLLAELQRKADEAAKLAVEKKALDEKYAAIINLADSQFNSGDYSAAKNSYSDALGLKTNEQYPKDLITKIDNLLAEQQRKTDEAAKLAAEKKALDEKYAAIINLADSQFNSGDYSAAKNSYSDALGLKANEQYPKDQITKIDNLLAEQQRKADEAAKLAAEKKALDEKYAAIINLADSQFNSGNYSAAKNSYSDALGLKANEQYPKDQTTKIDNLLAEQQRKADEAAKLAAEKKALDEKYAAIINLADSQFKSGDYVTAKNSYSDALGLKANEQYPKDQITKIDNLLAEQQRKADEAAKLAAEKKALDEKYAAIINLADSQFNAGDYSVAKNSYSDALGLKANEQYPKDQITKIDNLLAEQQRKADEAEKLAQQQIVDNKYLNHLKTADNFYDSEQWSLAISEYRQALNVKPNEVYPKNKINEIETILAEIERDAAEKNQLKNKYNKLIAAADQQFEKEEFEFAKLNYIEALEYFPDELYPNAQIKKIDVLLERIETAKRNEQELNERYSEELLKADDSFKKDQYSVARHHYNSALELKPNEKYPKEMLIEIDKRLEALKVSEQETVAKNPVNFEKKLSIIQEREYAELIKKADESFRDSEFTVAKVMYERSLDIFDREYPKKQLKEIHKKIQEDKNSLLTQEYKQLIANGDRELSENHYSVAKFYYNKAIELNYKEKYPKSQVEKIEELLQLRKDKKLDKEYDDLLKKAEDAFDKGNLSVARFYYKKALQIKKNEKYPKEKLIMIQSMQSKD